MIFRGAPVHQGRSNRRKLILLQFLGQIEARSRLVCVLQETVQISISSISRGLSFGVGPYLRSYFWIVDEESAQWSLSNWTLAVAQGTLGSPGAESFAEPFRQGNRAAAVEIHSNVHLRRLGAELAIANPGYAVLEYS